MRALNRQLKLYYRANPGLTPIQLTMAQVRSREPGYPHLKAKAAQTRHLAGFSLILARRHAMGDATRPPFGFRRGSRYADRVEGYRRLVVELFEGLNEYYVGTEEAAYDVNACKRGVYKYLRSLGELNAIWREGVPE